MTAIEAIRGSLGSVWAADEAAEGTWVTTACLYPSNASIRVLVRGGSELFVVSDEAGAIHEVTSSGLAFPSPDRRIRHIVRRQGLKIKNGVIYSPDVPSQALGAVITLVANTSKEAAHWGYEHSQFSSSKNFREELLQMIDTMAGRMVEHNAFLIGASNKQHRFEHVIRRDRNRITVIDPVMNDPSSINAKVVAHLDIRQKLGNTLRQRLIYDDRIQWMAADINLLKVGATPVPFSGIREVLPKLVA